MGSDEEGQDGRVDGKICEHTKGYNSQRSLKCLNESCFLYFS